VRLTASLTLHFAHKCAGACSRPAAASKARLGAAVHELQGLCVVGLLKVVLPRKASSIDQVSAPRIEWIWSSTCGNVHAPREALAIKPHDNPAARQQCVIELKLSDILIAAVGHTQARPSRISLPRPWRATLGQAST
jgi:hypothetical protein